MTHKERVDICNQCLNRDFSTTYGIICKITQNRPDFDDSCVNYHEDSIAKVTKIKNKEIFVQDQNKSINQGRIALFAIAAIQLLASYFSISMREIPFQLVIPDLVMAVLFLGLGILSFKKSYLALLLGLFMYLTIILIVALISPITLFSGWLLKVIIITTLIYATSVAKSEEKRLRALHAKMNAN